MEIPFYVPPKRRKAKLDMGNIINGAKAISKREKERKDSMKEVHIGYGDIQDPYLYNMQGFIDRFRMVDTISDAELEALVYQNYLVILDAVNSMEPSSSNPYYVSLISLFTNHRFVVMLSNLLRSGVRLDGKRKYELNRIIYHYLTQTKIKDPVIEQDLRGIADTINMDLMHTMVNIGLTHDMATYIALAANSSMDDYINIRRVNLIMFNNPNGLSIQTIVDIYQYTFNRCMTALFEAIMFDVYSKDDLDNANNLQQEVYSMQVTAVLEMINQMPSNAIKAILTAYCMDYVASPREVRCGLYLSNDYARINEVINYIESVEGMYIPD